jgi:hypothetical protein
MMDSRPFGRAFFRIMLPGKFRPLMDVPAFV